MTTAGSLFKRETQADKSSLKTLYGSFRQTIEDMTTQVLAVPLSYCTFQFLLLANSFLTMLLAICVRSPVVEVRRRWHRWNSSFTRLCHPPPPGWMVWRTMFSLAQCSWLKTQRASYKIRRYNWDNFFNHRIRMIKYKHFKLTVRSVKILNLSKVILLYKSIKSGFCFLPRCKMMRKQTKSEFKCEIYKLKCQNNFVFLILTR